jgi:hypothetical protein
MNNSTENALKEDFFDLANDISKKFKITHSDALKIAVGFKRNIIEAERNSIFEAAFAVSNSKPSALEAIAMQLGYTPDGFRSTIVDAINSLND